MKSSAAFAAMAVTAFAGAACRTPADGRGAGADPSVAELIRTSIPPDLPHRTLLDFEGRVHLVGYALEPEGPVPPGGKVTITMVWRSVSPLSPGWQLFTHLLDDRGRQIANHDNKGPLRQLEKGEDGREWQRLRPSLWEPGKIYVDRQEIDIPGGAKTAWVSIAVGVWRAQERSSADGGSLPSVDTRLQIVGGKSDGKNRGLVTRILTGPSEPRPGS